ncbi:hypothetical protein [Lampropedia aestuarii]|uniref:hypothetical protein n=1 Tax=Lampropedia aestuarii TaxID=2562762 RepID=UPI002469AD65|nr:hypothetical protein [Lampropedia aestuarii]MDH5856233.1 hypothetical protein [Lampropedia aestuarii]
MLGAKLRSIHAFLQSIMHGFAINMRHWVDGANTIYQRGSQRMIGAKKHFSEQTYSKTANDRHVCLKNLFTI